MPSVRPACEIEPLRAMASSRRIFPGPTDRLGPKSTRKVSLVSLTRRLRCGGGTIHRAGPHPKPAQGLSFRNRRHPGRSTARRCFTLEKGRACSHDMRIGQVAEWLKALAWKACIRETVSWVRIPPCPPRFQQLNLLPPDLFNRGQFSRDFRDI